VYNLVLKYRYEEARRELEFFRARLLKEATPEQTKLINKANKKTIQELTYFLGVFTWKEEDEKYEPRPTEIHDKPSPSI